MLDTDTPRLTSNRDRVLARLLRGPATNTELRDIGGSRAMGRVHELSHEYDIDVAHQRGGTWVVTLHGKKAVHQVSLFEDLHA